MSPDEAAPTKEKEGSLVSSNSLVKVWSPDDARALFDRAALVKAAEATQCSHALRVGVFRFTCDETGPHSTHTNAALAAKWVTA